MALIMLTRRLSCNWSKKMKSRQRIGLTMAKTSLVTLSVGLDDQCFSEMLYCTTMGTVSSSCVLIGLSRALGALNFSWTSH